ncbi:MAG: efflux RND transporter periplasmic adaptor subunit [Pirellulales bacterium]
MTCSATLALGHEGHEALPTKGASVRGDTVLLSPEARKAVGLSMIEVRTKDLERTLIANGAIEIPWHQHAYATTRVTGRINSVTRKPGDQVQAGDLLAEVESLELIDEQLELIQDHLELELAAKTLARAESLGRQGIVPGKDVATARATRSEKSSAIEIVRQKLLAIGFSGAQLMELMKTKQLLRTLPIIAPISGTLVHADVNPGQVVEPTTHLFEIVDFSKVWMKASVVEAESYRVAKGQLVRVTVAALPEKVFEGKIDVVGLQADPRTRALPVWIELLNPVNWEPALRPGMFGRTEIVTDEAKNATVVPSAAIVASGAESWLFVQQQPGAYLRKNVVLGARNNGDVQIKGGVYAGDLVVQNGSRQLAAFFVQGTFDVPVETQRNIGLKLEKVGSRPVDKTVTINGVIEVPPDRMAFTSSQVAGKIAKILIDRGDRATKGQPLVQVESLVFQDLQLSLLQFSERAALAKSLLEASREAGSVVAGQQTLQRETDYLKAANELQVLEDKLLSLGLSSEEVQRIRDGREPLNSLTVRSPIDGAVVEVAVIPGQVITAGEPLIEVHDRSRVWVRGNVFEQDVEQIDVAQPARVRVTSDPRFEATAQIVRTNNIVSGPTRVLSVWAEIDNPTKQLKHNMLAQMSVVVGKSEPTIAVPVSAVLTQGHENYVFVQVPWKANRFERRQIETGNRSDRFIEVRRGLKAGQQVAVSGVQQLQTAFASVR